MPSINQSTADASIDLDGYKSHYATAGAMTVTIEHYLDTSDPSSLFVGLPDDACQCPHWGFVQAGRMAFRYTDGSVETIEAGSAYYIPPGHVPVGIAAGTRSVEISPTDALNQTMEVVMANVAKAAS